MIADPLLQYSISKRVSCWSFREISWYLHFVNYEDLVPRGDPMHDRLGKVRPLIDDPATVDEAMIKFQGCSASKKYMPMKPIKRGIKVWVLGDGYFSRVHEQP